MHLIIDQAKKNTILPSVIRAAVQLFVEKGIDGTTIKDIAALAHVSEGALYRHFKSKEALAWHIFVTHVNDFSIDLLAAVRPHKKTKDKIHAYISTCFKAFEEEQELFTYLLVSEHRELRNLPPSYKHPGHVAMELVEEGQKAGDLKPMDVYVAGSIFVGAIIRLCVAKMYGGIKGDLRKHTDEVAASLWGALNNK